MGSPFLALARIAAYLSLTFALLPVQIFAVWARLELAVRLPLFYHRICARILGFRIRLTGGIRRGGPILYACNHTSYADITILGALLPASFVAKAEISDWPLFGLLARLQRSVFVDRRGIRTMRHRDEVARRLENGDSLILFPEGTSSDGNSVLPFKSALFAAAQGLPAGSSLQVQPVSIAYTRLDGMPVGRALRPYFAWYGDMELASHVWEVAGLGRVTVDVVFHPPVTADRFATRRKLADHCHEAVRSGVSAANAGRLDRFTSPAPS